MNETQRPDGRDAQHRDDEREFHRERPAPIRRRPGNSERSEISDASQDQDAERGPEDPLVPSGKRQVADRFVTEAVPAGGRAADGEDHRQDVEGPNRKGDNLRQGHRIPHRARELKDTAVLERRFLSRPETVDTRMMKASKVPEAVHRLATG